MQWRLHTQGGDMGLVRGRVGDGRVEGEGGGGGQVYRNVTILD